MFISLIFSFSIYKLVQPKDRTRLIVVVSYYLLKRALGRPTACKTATARIITAKNTLALKSWMKIMILVYQLYLFLKGLAICQNQPHFGGKNIAKDNALMAYDYFIVSKNAV